MISAIFPSTGGRPQNVIVMSGTGSGFGFGFSRGDDPAGKAAKEKETETETQTKTHTDTDVDSSPVHRRPTNRKRNRNRNRSRRRNRTTLPNRPAKTRSKTKTKTTTTMTMTRSMALVLLVALLQLQMQTATRTLQTTDAAFLGGVQNPNPNTNCNSNNFANPKPGPGPKPKRDRKSMTARKQKPKRPRYVFQKTSATAKDESYEYEYEYFTATGNLPPLQASTGRSGSGSRSGSASGANEHTQNHHDVLVTYTNDPSTVGEWLASNLPGSKIDGRVRSFLGFDIERLPARRSTHPDPSDRSDFAHAAVVQLSTIHACLVVHLLEGGQNQKQNQKQKQKQRHPRHSGACAEILASVLEDPAVVKAGCSIDEDLVLLHELWRDKSHRASKSCSCSCSCTEKESRRKTKTGRGRKKHKPGFSMPSLKARSRFDLGCVVLPKKQYFANNATGGRLPLVLPSNQTQTQTQTQTASAASVPLPVAPGRKIAAANITTHASSSGSRGRKSPGHHKKPLIRNKSGLQGLCRAILGIELPKEASDCKSDWTAFPLTDDQITYAARDAWAGVAIATELERDHEVFERSNLASVLGANETPLPELAQRHRQRKEAKVELEALLHPYAEKFLLIQEQLLEEQEPRKVDETALEHNGHRPPTILEHEDEHEDVAELFVPNEGTLPWSATATATATATNHTVPRARGNESFPPRSLLVEGNEGAILPKRIGSTKAKHRTVGQENQKRKQALENNLPKRIRKKTTALRQIVNAKVIDHKVVFEIDLVQPDGGGQGTFREILQRSKPKEE